jgi:uncharacterized protein
VTDFAFRDRMAGIPVYDELGTRDRPCHLTVRFHPARTDAALRSLGRELWTVAHGRAWSCFGVRMVRRTHVLASDGGRGRDQREALVAAAGQFGKPMALPG